MVEVIYLPLGAPRPNDAKAFYVQLDSSGQRAAITDVAGIEGMQNRPITGDMQAGVDRAKAMAELVGYPKVYVLPRAARRH